MTEREFVEQSKELLIKFAEVSMQFWKDNPEYCGRRSDWTTGEYIDGSSILNTTIDCSFQDGELAVISIGAGNYDSKLLQVTSFPRNSGFFEFKERFEDHREKIEEVV